MDDSEAVSLEQIRPFLAGGGCLAVMERHGLKTILSFDGGFDHWPGLSRLHQI